MDIKFTFFINRCVKVWLHCFVPQSLQSNQNKVTTINVAIVRRASFSSKMNSPTTTNSKRDQQQLKIPDDPMEWTVAQVKHWIRWAVKIFQLTSIKLQDWSVSVKELYEMDHTDFKLKVLNDPGDLFWVHLDA